jgi:hypothetical protein
MELAPVIAKALRAAFEADRIRQLDELRWQILHRYGVQSFDSFMAHVWWGWDYRITPPPPWREDEQ